jgi:hypothetical protein
MFVIVPFLKVRLSDHSAREILYDCPCAIQERVINAAESRVIKRDLIFILNGFIIFIKLLKLHYNYQIE